MTQAQIQQLFQQRYNQTNWKKFIGENFPGVQLYTTPAPLIGINHDVATEALHLGNIMLNEGGIERTIAVYEVTLAPGIVLERNRIGLRNLLRKYWKNINGAFIVYHRPENPNWRFTYVSELTDWNEEGEQIKVSTEPKRYTYVLGEGESVRTAAERFAILAAKRTTATLDDVKDAFSVEKLSKAFFDEYKRHYQAICDYLLSTGFKQSVFKGDEKAIRDFSKKLLGRIVFLYFIQKKGWLGVPVSGKWGDGDMEYLSRLFAQAKHKELFYSEYLSKLFFDTLNAPRTNDLIELVNGEPCRIPFLNGGLFEEEDKKHRNLVFDKHLFSNLFDFFNQYNFTIYEDDPNDHTVAVDPEMLGHIFENLLEDNKDKGAFYTPKEIVHYMCQESLIEYLSTWFENKGYEVTSHIGLDKPDQAQLFSANEGRKGQLVLESNGNGHSRKIDRSLIEKLLKKQLDEADKALVLQHKAEFETALDTVKICDPAIGSGAFPMGLLHEIFTAKQTLYTFEHGNTQGFDASGVKLNIIQNSIYGVDIECGAVDIARLRFWLSLIVDEPAPKAQPNLDYKIVVGNSLVSKLGDDIVDIDWEIKGGTQNGIFGNSNVEKRKEILQQISNKQKAYFKPEGNKKQLATEIRNLKIDLLINQLEFMIKESKISAEPKQINYKSKAKYTEAFKLYIQTISWRNHITNLKALKAKPEEPLMFFDWKLDFPEVMNEQVTEQVGFDIVIANPPYVDIKNLPVEFVKVLFEKFTTTENRINLYSIFVEKGWSLLKNNATLSFIIPNSILLNSSYSRVRKMLLQSVNKIIKLPDNIFINAIVETIILQAKNTKSESIVLGAYYKNDDLINFDNLKFSTFQQTEWVEDSKNRFNIFVTSEVIRLTSKIENSRSKISDFYDFTLGITPYDKYKGHSESLIKNREFHSTVRINNSYVPLISGSNILRYIVSNEVKEYLKYGEWLGAPRQLKFFKGPRVIVRQIISGKPSKIYAGYTDQELYHTQIGFSIKAKSESTNSAKLLCSILNSRLINFYHTFKFTDPEKDTFQKILIENCKQLPFISNIPLTIKSKLEQLVDVVGTYTLNSQETSTAEQQIDNLVYKLYDLSYEEVKVIDPEFSLSEAEYAALDVEAAATV